MIYPTLTRGAAEEYVRARLDGQSPRKPIDEITDEAGCSPKGNMADRIRELEEAWRDLLPILDEKQFARFEARGAVAIHRALGELPVRVATDAGFWRYLACGPLYEFVVRRYPESMRNAKRANLANFGIGKAWEALPERLWFRAHIGYDPGAPDPYGLVRRGGIDFWVSGLIRVLYSSNRELARAFVEFQFPTDGKFEGTSYRPATLGTDAVREMYKRLRHFDVTTVYAALDDQQARDLIEDLAKDLRRMKA